MLGMLGPRPIEGYRLGLRVHTSCIGEASASPTNPEPATLRELKLDYVDPSSGRRMELSFLRQTKQVEGLHPGDTVRLKVLELELEGSARVLDVKPCPPLEQGPGHLVTGTIRSDAEDVFSLRLTGIVAPIQATGRHPFY